MNLLIEIGNTALKAAWADGVTLGKTFRYQGERRIDYIESIIEREKPEIMTVASSCELSQADENRLSRMCTRLLILDSSRQDVRKLYRLPDCLGYDRVASLVAVRHLFKGKPCTLFDLGTTMTVDFLSSEGEYEGGNISLGCRTRFKALNRYSRSLPLVDTPADVPPLGDNLTNSIESGIITGIMFELQGYIDRKPENIIVFTGGDAIYFVKKMKNSIFAVCNLVLMGLALITDDYVSRID